MDFLSCLNNLSYLSTNQYILLCCLVIKEKHWVSASLTSFPADAKMHFVTKANEGNPSWSKLPVLCSHVALCYPGTSEDGSFHEPEESILSP